MSLVHAVEVPRLPVSRLEPVIGASAVCGAGRRRRPGPAGAGRAHHLERQFDRGRWRGRRDAAGPGRVRAGPGHPDRLAGDRRRRRVLRDHQAAAQPDPRQPVRSPARRGGGRSLRTDAGGERGGAGCPDPARRCGAAARPADRRAGRAAGRRGRPGGVALPHRGGLGRRGDPGWAGVPAPAPGRRGGLRVLAPGLRPVVASCWRASA